MGSDALLKAGRRRRCGWAAWASAAVVVACVVAASVALSRPWALAGAAAAAAAAVPAPAGFVLNASRWRLRRGAAASSAVSARWNATGCRHVEAGPGGPGYPSALPKRAASGPRFVFFAGLEGTGHHYYGSLARAANATPLPRRVAAFLGRMPHDSGLFGAGPDVTVAAAARDAAAAVAALRELAGGLDDSAVVAVNTMDEFPDGMLSYSAGPEKGGFNSSVSRSYASKKASTLGEPNER